MADLSVYNDVNTLPDYMQANKQRNFKNELLKQEINLKQQRMAQGGDLPAALRLANEYEAARRSGDVDRANSIAAFAKTVDKNVYMGEDGTYQPLPGLPGALGQVEYGKGQGSQLGKKQVDSQYNPIIAGGEAQARLDKELEYAPQIAQETQRAKGRGEKLSELGELEATLPQLETTVEKLSDLGKKATYTYKGQILDSAIREVGMEPREGAIARKEYISLVDNQILPLLRQTFGAQFTEREGQSLKATLGDPNASPEEKDAVLRSFIDQKKAQIETMRRRLGERPQSLYDRSEAKFKARKADPMQESQQAIMQRQSEMGVSPGQRQDLTPRKGQVVDGYLFNGGDPSDQNNWKKVR